MKGTMCLRQGGDGKAKANSPRGLFANEKCMSFHQLYFFVLPRFTPQNILLVRMLFCCLQLSSDEYVARMLGMVFIPSLPFFPLEKASPCGCAR